MDKVTEQAQKLAYEARRHGVESLRHKYRAVVRRLDHRAAGFANTDAEFAEMVGIHVARITVRAGLTPEGADATVREGARRAFAANGLPGLLGFITETARAVSVLRVDVVAARRLAEQAA